MTEEIKPCPFCGSADVQWCQSEWDFGCVECGNCNTRGPIVDGYNQEQTEDESIEKWNTRKYEVENFHACIGELVSEMDQLRAEPTAAQERKWVLHYLSDRACHLKITDSYEGSRALERAERAIEKGEHWPKDKGTL